MQSIEYTFLYFVPLLSPHIFHPPLKCCITDSYAILFFSCYEKRLHSPFLPLHRQNKEVWVSGLNQHTANVPDRKVPKVRILLLPHFGSLAQLDQSTTLRTSGSGVRVSHESQHWRFGRVGLLHRS